MKYGSIDVYYNDKICQEKRLRSQFKNRALQVRLTLL